MRRIMILISSLAFVGLGMTACSKDSSKRQSRMRNNAEKLTPAQMQARNASGQNTGGTPVGKLIPEAADNHISRKGITQLCELDITQVFCNSILVGIVDGEIVPIDFEGALYERSTTIAKMEVLKEEDGRIIAESSVVENPRKQKLRVLQIMKDDAKLTLPDELQASTIIIPTDEMLTGVQQEIAKLDTLIDKNDHLVVLTNVDKLMDDSKKLIAGNLKEQILGLTQTLQKEIIVAKADKASDVIALENAFLKSYPIMTTYELIVDSDKEYDVDNIEFTLNESVLSKDQMMVTVLEKHSATKDAVRITITDLSVFTKGSYSLKMVLTEK